MTREEAIKALDALRAKYSAPQCRREADMTRAEKIGTELELAMNCFYDVPSWMTRGYPRFDSLRQLWDDLLIETKEDPAVAAWMKDNARGLIGLVQVQGTKPWGVVDPKLPKGVDR